MSPQDDKSYDIGGILSRMREEYWEGLSEQEAESRELLDCLVFVLGGERFAFETQYAGEVIRIPKLIKVPAVQSLIAGIFNLRGEITAAMDIRPMLGLPQPEFPASGRILVVKSDTFSTGILVEAALGVRGLPFDCFEPAAAGTGGEASYTRGHFNEEDGAIILLDLEALLASPEILVGEP